MWGKANIKVTKSHYCWGIPSGYTLTELTQKSGYDLTQLTLIKKQTNKMNESDIESFYNNAPRYGRLSEHQKSKEDQYVNPFNLGDRVKSLVDEDCYLTYIHKGEVGTVIRVGYKTCHVLFDRADINWEMKTSDLQSTGGKVHVCSVCGKIEK